MTDLSYIGTMPTKDTAVDMVQNEELQCALRLATGPHSSLRHLGTTTRDAKEAKELDMAAILHAAIAPNPELISTLGSYRQACALITKNPCLSDSDPVKREAQASELFFKIMRKNSRTTKRLTYYIRHPQRMPRLMDQVLSTARMKLFKLLGPCPGAQEWDRFQNAKVFSKGTVQGITRGDRPYSDVNPYAKLTACTTFTGSRRCLERFGPILIQGQFQSLLHDYLLKGELKVKEVDSSEAVCVPKDANTDRFIAIEPMLNAMAQQGICAMLSPLLRQWGITLTDQSRNVDLARHASNLGFTPDGLATIDLSSASDTITTEVVKYLLPPLWFDLLDDARTHSIVWEDTEHVTSSFSTMGNAFTFPLQCLIFSSLVQACIAATSSSERSWRVYGDDIICPLSASLLLLESLKFVGFIPNVNKSFVTGFFRESCGGDFIQGIDVRPVYLKGDIEELIIKHQYFNALQRVRPGSPVLPYLYNTVKRPLVGPAIGPGGGETSHFVAPVFYLRKRRMVTWKSSVQSYIYRYACLNLKSRKRRRGKDTLASYCCALLGDYGRYHDIRGTQSTSIVVRFTTTPWIEASYAPLWYATPSG